MKTPAFGGGFFFAADKSRIAGTGEMAYSLD